MPDNSSTDSPESGPLESQTHNRIDVENSKGDLLRKEDVIFNSTEGHICVHLNRGISPEFLYCEGYLKAARILANHACVNEDDRDILLFPIAFLYRHHLELALKDLIQTAHLVASGQRNTLKVHPLAQLWRELKKVSGKLNELPSKNDLDAVEAYIKQLELVDEQGQAFRYATSTKGKSHLSEFKVVDIRLFAEAMERLAGYLSGISWRLDVLLDHVTEIAGYKKDFETNP
jgi:hypothetical protein